MDDRLSELKIKIKIKDGLARFNLPSSTAIVTSLVELSVETQIFYQLNFTICYFI
jgi:hypothetical protein